MKEITVSEKLYSQVQSIAWNEYDVPAGEIVAYLMRQFVAGKVDMTDWHNAQADYETEAYLEESKC